MTFKFTLTFLMFLIVSSSIAQIKGSYIYSAGVDAGSRTLTFNKSNFTDETIGHVSGKFGHGSFKIQNNSLYLNYFKIIDKDSSVSKSIHEMRYLDSLKYIFRFLMIKHQWMDV